MIKRSEFHEITQEQWCEWLRPRTSMQGAWDEALFKRAVAAYTCPGGVVEDCYNTLALPPRLKLYRDASLPEKVAPVDAHGVLHVAMGGDRMKAAKQMEVAYNMPVKLDEPEPAEEERTTEGVRVKVHRSTMLIDKRVPGPGNKPTRSAYRSRSEYDPLNGPDRSRRILNTWGHVLDWGEEYRRHCNAKEQKPDEVTLWEYYQQRMFSDEVMAKFTGTKNVVQPVRTPDGEEERCMEGFRRWKDWLRSLRVMRGLSTVDLSVYVDHKGSNPYSRYEYEPTLTMNLPLALRILKNNAFAFPEVEEDSGNKVPDPVYAKKFMTMLGLDYIDYVVSHDKTQFLSTISAMSEAYLHQELDEKQLPLAIDMVNILHRAASDHVPLKIIKQTNTKQYVYPHIENHRSTHLFRKGLHDYTDAFLALPHHSPTHGITASNALTRDQAFGYASSRADGLGKFLWLYRDAIGQSTSKIGARAGWSKVRVRQIETALHHSDDMVKKILGENNPYLLPENEQGKVCEDVAEHVHDLQRPPCKRGINKSLTQSVPQDKEAAWLVFAKAATHLCGVMTPEKEARNLLPAKVSDFSTRWKKRVGKQLAGIAPGDEGTIRLRGVPIRCRRSFTDEIELDMNAADVIREAFAL